MSMKLSEADEQEYRDLRDAVAGVDDEDHTLAKLLNRGRVRKGQISIVETVIGPAYGLVAEAAATLAEYQITHPLLVDADGVEYNAEVITDVADDLRSAADSLEALADGLYRVSKRSREMREDVEEVTSVAEALDVGEIGPSGEDLIDVERELGGDGPGLAPELLREAKDWSDAAQRGDLDAPGLAPSGMVDKGEDEDYIPKRFEEVALKYNIPYASPLFGPPKFGPTFPEIKGNG